MKKILVIGGTGFIGYHFIKKAKKKKFQITSISLKKPSESRFHSKVKYIQADISNFNNLKKKLPTEFDYVLNAGGYGAHPSFGKDGDKLIKAHFLGLINILQVVSIKKVKKFVQIGSSAEYGKAKSPLTEELKNYPETPYAIAKLSCTTLLRSLYNSIKLPSTTLRLFQVYGPKQGTNRILPFLIKNCLKNKKFLTTQGKQFCDFCYVDDVVNAIFKTLKSKKTDGEIINIGIGKPIQIKKLISLIVKKIGKGIPVIGGLNYKKGVNMKSYPSIKKAKKKLNWTPKVDLIEGLNKTIKSYR